MPRVTSEKTRQVILVQDPVFHEMDAPERIALFNEEHQMISVSLVSKGPWAANSGYAENDLVTFEGSTYRAKTAIASNLEGNDPPDVDLTTWELLAEKGETGIEGLNWRGDWNASDTYAERDAVFHVDSSYRALKAVGAGGQSPDTPYALVPAGNIYSGLEATLWDTSSNTLNEVITASDHLVDGRYVHILKVPIATPGAMQVDVDYPGDGYLEIYRPDGSLFGANDDWGPVTHSRVSGAVVAGNYYLIFRSRNAGAPAGAYTAVIALTAGATYGVDSPPWKPIALAGTDGEDGAAGAAGANGQGVPLGGADGQVLTKTSGVDFATAWEDPAGGGGIDYRGLWVAQAYPAGAVVRHANGLYYATVAAVAGDVPGVDPNPLVSFTGSGYSAARMHKRLTSLVQEWDVNTGEENYAYFYFDVTTAGTGTINKEPNAAGNGFMRVYNAAGSNFASPGNNDYSDNWPVGRWFVRIEPSGSPAQQSGTIKFVETLGVINEGSVNPWVLMVQGV